MEKPVHDLSSSWRSSLLCSAGACVEVCDTSRSMLIRDSKQVGGGTEPVLRLSYDAFATFRFEVLRQAHTGHTAHVSWRRCGGRMKLATKDHGVVLDFNMREWAAFTRGLAAGEFSPRLISTHAA